MVLDTWLSVILFLLLVAPGLLFDLLAGWRRVGVPESTFREISRIVVASLAFSGFGFGALAIVRTFAPAWMPDPQGLLQHGGAYFTEQYRLVLRALLIEAAIAVTFAVVAHLILARRSRATLRPVSTWRKVLRDECPRGREPYVRVRLSDGTVYVGRVGYYTADLEVADRELVLAPPLFARTGDKPLAPVPGEWQRVVVRGSAVQTMTVQYRPQQPSSEQHGVEHLKGAGHRRW